VAKQLETSLERFARRESPTLWLVLSGVIVLSLLILLILSASAGNWLYAVLIAVAFVAAVIFSAGQLLNFRKIAASSERKRIDWETAQPEIQRQNLKVEVFELSRLLEVESEHISDLQTAYIVAEDLALRQIQQEENVPLLRHVTIGKTPFEAVMVKDDVISCIDVSFLVIPDIRQEKIDAMIRKIEVVKNTFADMGLQMKVRLMVVLVTQLTPEDEDLLRIDIKNRFKNLPAGLTTVVSLLDFESLQKIYVTE
jgi:hypothetical protein